MAEPRDARSPFTLNTGRLRDQWHGMSRTGTSGRAFAHVAEPSVQMHPQDMARRQLEAGDLVHLTSRRGSIVVPVQADTDLAPGQVFLAMHWGGSAHLGGSSSTGAPLAGVNTFTTPARCPDSRPPELKHAAVKVLKAEPPWSLLAQAWLPPDRALQAQAQLRLEAFLVAGDTRAQTWIQTVLQDQCDARAFGRQLLAPVTRPPDAVATRDKPVCTCFNVSRGRIAAALADTTGAAGCISS